MGNPAADQPLADLEAREMAAVEKLDDAHDLAHDLRADAVAGQDENFAVGAGLSHVSVPEISTVSLYRANGVPAKAGPHSSAVSASEKWVPAFAGTAV